MRSTIFSISLYLTVSLLACQDSRDENLKNVAPGHAAYKAIGEQIPTETGMRWIETYKGSSQAKLGLGLGLGGLLDLNDYEISDTQLQAAMQSVTGLTGMAFHYGLDEDGEKHIMVIPIDASLRLWEFVQAGRIIVDANTDTQISLSTASAWAQNYQDEHPTGIWFHFFGSDIFDDILLIPFFDSLDIQPALSDLLLPQMLLIIWDPELPLLGGIGGRTMSDRTIVYDASNPCPPCGVQ
jgi:hypothetical protein